VTSVPIGPELGTSVRVVVAVAISAGTPGTRVAMAARIMQTARAVLTVTGFLKSAPSARNGEGREDLLEPHSRCDPSTASAAIIGAEMRHVRTSTEPPTASSRNDPATSPAASTASASASDVSETFATLEIRMLLLLVSLFIPTRTGRVR